MTSPPNDSTERLARLGWLDALRGIAALVVVFDHSSYSFLPEFRRELMPEFNTSRYGIMVFFLVSGYIIPASLERRGCVRTFWIGRVFRIYPLCVAAVGAVLVLSLLGVAELRTGSSGLSAGMVALAHLTLFQELLGTPNLLLVLWTLSYEMAFYLLVVALFTVRRHQRSAPIAMTLASLAAVSVAAGITLPASALSDAVGTGRLIVLTAIALTAAICCTSASSPRLRVFGGGLGGALALVLVLFNGTVPVWEGLVILAAMFLGTAVHRAEHGRSSWWYAACTAAVVVACSVGSAYGHGDGDHFTRRAWITAFLLAVLTFGVGLALRHRRVPRLLIGLGTISYSVYLLHPILLTVSDGTIGRWRQNSPVLEVAFFAVLLPLCALSYQYVEAPGQAWGRKLARSFPGRPRPRPRPRDPGPGRGGTDDIRCALPGNICPRLCPSVPSRSLTVRRVWLLFSARQSRRCPDGHARARGASRSGCRRAAPFGGCRSTTAHRVGCGRPGAPLDARVARGSPAHRGQRRRAARRSAGPAQPRSRVRPPGGGRAGPALDRPGRAARLRQAAGRRGPRRHGGPLRRGLLRRTAAHGHRRAALRRRDRGPRLHLR
ncbi:acyltransferase family protein [Streptomyces sp. NPDC020898]|uniref:acyltransferase family protein n=1 Tax=Streptomyces sp. NPDC020898 TaxID=3365101 RepID=UPI0037B323B4